MRQHLFGCYATPSGAESLKFSEYTQEKGHPLLQAFLAIWRLLSRHERRSAFALCCLVLTAALVDAVGVASIVPFLAALSDPAAIQSNPVLGRLSAYLPSDTPQAFLTSLGWLTLGLIICGSVLQAITQHQAIRFSELRRVNLSERLIRRYLSQPYAFFLSQHSGNLAKNLLSEVDAVINRNILPAVLLVAHGLHALILIALVIAIEPTISIIAIMVVTCAFGIIFMLMKKKIGLLGLRRINANRVRYTIATEIFTGIKIVKLEQLEYPLLQKFKQSTTEVTRCTAASETASIYPYFGIQILVFGGMIMMLLVFINQGRNISDILPTVGLLAFAGLRILPKFQIVYQSLAKIRFGTPALEALQTHLNMPETEPSVSELITPLVPTQQIALESVTFRYPNTEAVAVEDLSLTIPVNSSIGLVGASGAGKTTAIDLLLALYAPQEGQLRVDDTIITADNRRAWQRSIGYVPQDIFLLDASVRENIAFGIPHDEIDDAAVEHAAKQANLHEFVTTQLQEGYATRVGERGIRLSGGQKQRIGIARALYRQPSVLVFDEATSAVDNVTEREIVAALTSLGGQKTIIMIAHRLDTVRHCDCIYLMERGKVVASGTFDELAASEKRFQNMLGKDYVK